MAVARGLPTTRIRTESGYPRVSSESWLPRTPTSAIRTRSPSCRGALRVAVAVIALQAAALTVIAAIVLVKTVIGHPDNVARAVLDALLALLGAGVLAACARGLVHLRPAARSPVIVIELLTAVVSFSLGFQAGLIQYGGPLMLSAVVVLYLLFTPPVRAVLDRHYD